MLSANASSFQAAYEFSNVWWTPQLTYRYALFSGDDPDTHESEAFDSLLTGFYDWGTWWQGEIAGEYFLSNSNLLSHMARIHLEPHSKVSGGVIFFKFLVDEPASFGPGVTDKDIAVEADVYVDWKINGNFTANFIARIREPAGRRTAGVQSHQELRLRHGVHRLQLLNQNRSTIPPVNSNCDSESWQKPNGSQTVDAASLSRVPV